MTKFYDEPTYIGCSNQLDKRDKRLKKFEKQYRKTGFDDTVTWGLDISISEFILPRLIRFRETCNGYPGCLSNKNEWNAILDKMIYAFEKLKEDSLNLVTDKKVKKGFKLFYKYYSNLWS
jgi:hypothetical protein